MNDFVDFYDCRPTSSRMLRTLRSRARGSATDAVGLSSSLSGRQRARKRQRAAEHASLHPVQVPLLELVEKQVYADGPDEPSRDALAERLPAACNRTWDVVQADFVVASGVPKLDFRSGSHWVIVLRGLHVLFGERSVNAMSVKYDPLRYVSFSAARCQ